VNIVPYENQQERKDTDKMLRGHRCWCGGTLTTPAYGGAYGLPGQHIVFCGQDKAHEGFERLKGYYEEMRQGTGIPVHVAMRYRNRKERGNGRTV